MIIIGSVGNNLGNNLVSLGHTEKKKIERQKTIHKEIKQRSRSSSLSKVSPAPLPSPVATEDIEETRKESSTALEVGEAGSTKALVGNGGVAADTAEHDKDDIGEYKGPQTSPYWLVGTIIFVLGSLFTFAAFGFAAQSLLASLESVQFISNVIFAKTVHKHVITRRMLVSTLSILCGNVLVVIFSDHEEKLLDSSQITNLFLSNPVYHGYIAR